MASVPEAEFCDYLRTTSALGRELTSAALLRMARGLVGGRTQPLHHRSPPRPRKCKFTPDCGTSDDAVFELLNHCQLLSDVLRPIYDDGDVEFSLAERRIVGRLLAEMAGLIDQLVRERSYGSISV